MVDQLRGFRLARAAACGRSGPHAGHGGSRGHRGWEGWRAASAGGRRGGGGGRGERGGQSGGGHSGGEGGAVCVRQAPERPEAAADDGMTVEVGEMDGGVALLIGARAIDRVRDDDLEQAARFGAPVVPARRRDRLLDRRQKSAEGDRHDRSVLGMNEEGPGIVVVRRGLPVATQLCAMVTASARGR